MSQYIDNLIKKAISDIDFQNELKIHEPKNYKVSFFWGKEKKFIYASIYMGYLIAKGNYKESDYK